MSDGPIEREALTAALVRDYDDEQIVLWIHALQDREEELEAEVERNQATIDGLLGTIGQMGIELISLRARIPNPDSLRRCILVLDGIAPAEATKVVADYLRNLLPKEATDG